MLQKRDSLIFLGMLLLALSLPLATNLVNQSQDDRSRATESSTSKVSFKIAFKGVKPSSNCLNSLTKIKVEVANKTANVYQSDINATITPVSNETNTNGDQVFLVSNLNLDSKFNNVNNFNYLRVKGPNHLTSRLCLNNQNTKLDEVTTCDINLKNTNTTVYNFSNYELIPGDINQDGTINSVDYSIIKNNFNSQEVTCNRTGDISYDGIVNSLDASLLKESLSKQEDGEILTEDEGENNEDTTDELNNEDDTLETVTPTPSVWAKETYDPIETKNAKYKTLTDTLKIWISKPKGYTLTRIWAKDPYKQLHTYISNDYKKSSDKFINIFNHALSSNANGLKTKAAIAFNDMVSYKYGGHSTGYNKYAKTGLVIHEGKILRNEPTSHKYYRSDICWLDKNSLIHYINDIRYESERTPARTESIVKGYNEATMSGALNTVTATKIVTNGKNVYKRRKSSYAAVIQGFCQIDKNNFVYITTNSGWWGEQLANTLIKLGCKEGYHFDGGGSTNVFFKKPSDSKWTAVRGTKDPKYSRSPSWSISYWTEL